MASFWTSQRGRLSKWGVFRTAGYYLFGVLPDKLGVSIVTVYEYGAEALPFTSQASLSFAVLKSMDEWTEQDICRIESLGDVTRLPVFSGVF